MFNHAPSVLREAIVATVEALGAGKIRPEEMPVPEDTPKVHIRYAPRFGTLAAGRQGGFPYTIDAIAKFIGQTRKDKTRKDGVRATDAVVDMFGALELLEDGYLTENDIKDRTLANLGEVVSFGKRKRDAVEQANERQTTQRAETQRQHS